MKTSMKWTGYVAGGLILILLIGFFCLNWISAAALKRSASYATGVEARIDGVQVRPFAGTFEIDGFSLANPDQEAFESERFLYLNRSDGVFGLSQMFQSNVEIPEVTLQGLDLNVEQKDGTENYRLILDRLNAIAGDEESSSDQTYVIRELLIKDIRVTFHGYPGLQQKELHLADIQLTNVGTGKNGLSRSELVGIIIREAFNQMLRNPELLPGAALEGLRTGLDELGGLGKVGVQFLGNITDESGKVLKKLGEGAESVGKAIGDLFGGGEAGQDEKEE